MRRLVLCIWLLWPFSAAAGGDCARVVSLAPSLTELLFALDLADNIVGVSSYCHYPPAADRKARVGGLYDANYEALMRLAPSMVFVLDDNRTIPAELGKLGLRSTTASHRSLAGILDSVDAVGRVCGVEERARRLRGEMEAEIGRIREKTKGTRPRRVLVVVGRGDPGPVARNVFVSGRDGFYTDLLRLAGAENVYAGLTSGVASLSPEALAALQPEVILEVIQDFEERGWSLADIRRSWAPLDYIPAVRDGRIFVLQGDYTVVPGPRVVRLLRDIAVLLHPERML